ncbi:MAG: hypothetical protein JNN23_06890, partial [Chryseobacterium gambrini]|nr:hypothetical protein [Chryseobacterium gambrini]
IEINIPLNTEGKLDLEKQMDITNKSKMIKELKQELKLQFEKIASAKINIE